MSPAAGSRRRDQHLRVETEQLRRRVTEDLAGCGFAESGAQPVHDSSRMGIGALLVRVVRTPQEALRSGDVEIVDRHRVVLEGGMELPADVEARLLLQIRVDDGSRWPGRAG